MTVRSITLGRTGLSVPTISLGTWAYGGANKVGEQHVGWAGQRDSDAIAAMAAAHAAGITHWDTADVYGDGRSELLIGSMWARGVPRHDIVLATKVGWDMGGYPRWYHPDMVAAHIDASLRRLRTDVIDIFYLHHCDFGPDDVYLDPALEVIRAARDAGKIRFIGLSDWDSAKILRVIARVDPDVVQPYRNVSVDTWRSSGLAAWCEERRCGVAFFSPLRHGLLLGKYSRPTTFEDGDFRNGDPAFRDPATLARLIAHRDRLRERFGERCEEPVLGALLGALTADTPNACVLLGQRNPHQVAAARTASRLVLSRDEAGALREMYRG